MTIICDDCNQIHEFKRLELRKYKNEYVGICAYQDAPYGESMALLSSYLNGTMNDQGKVITDAPKVDPKSYPDNIMDLWKACVKAAETGHALHLPL